jgi:hypothetical protein
MKTTSKNTPKASVWGRKNLFLLLLAGVLILTGYVLMAGPGSTEQAFHPEIFSARRIIVAPAVCLAGYLLVIVAILWRK